MTVSGLTHDFGILGVGYIGVSVVPLSFHSKRCVKSAGLVEGSASELLSLGVGRHLVVYFRKDLTWDFQWNVREWAPKSH